MASRVRALLIGHLSLSLIIIHFLFFYITQNLTFQQFFNTDNDKTGLSVLFLWLLLFICLVIQKLKRKRTIIGVSTISECFTLHC